MNNAHLCMCVCAGCNFNKGLEGGMSFFKGLLHLIWGLFHSIQGLFHFIGKPMEEGDVRQIEWEQDLGCKSAITIQRAERYATYVLHHATCISCIPVCVCMCVSIKMLQPCIEYIQA